MNLYWWLGIAGVMALVEVFSLSFITLWFVVGGVAAFIAGMLGAELIVQIIVFLAVSLICLALLRPLVLKHRAIGESLESTPVGLRAVVIERIDPKSLTGRVETPDHMTWAALSEDGSPIEVGEHVLVTEQRSVKLVVQRETGRAEQDR